MSIRLPIKWKIMRKLCRSVGDGSSYIAACKAAGITQMTLWRWRRTVKTKLGVTFGDVLQIEWDKRVRMVEDAHYMTAMKGSERAQEHFLHNRGRDRWRKDPDTVINVGDDNSRHLTQIFKAAPTRIIFDDGEGDRRSGLDEVVPEDCEVTPPQEIKSSGPQTEGADVCSEQSQP